MFKANSLVAFKYDDKGYPFKKDEIVLFLGEIEQMPGHCIIANKAGKVLWGYHTGNFRECTENEI